MNQERALRLQKKYAGSSAGPQKKEMSVGRRGPSAMGAHGKPKNAGGTFLRLVKYLSREKGTHHSCGSDDPALFGVHTGGLLHAASYHQPVYLSCFR